MSERQIITRTMRSYNWGPFYINVWTHGRFPHWDRLPGILIQWIGWGKPHPNQCEFEVEEEPHE